VGIWRICAVIAYATKYCLAAAVTPTARGQDALACLAAAVQHAEHLLQLEDLRSDRGEVDLVDETTGELLRTIPARMAVVSDNGPLLSQWRIRGIIHRRRPAAAPRPHPSQEPADHAC
jgi:hypothetical protein